MQQLHFSGQLTLTHSPHRVDHGSWREGAHWRWTVRCWQDVIGAGGGHSDPAGAALRVRVGVGIEPHVRSDLRLDFDWKLREGGGSRVLKRLACFGFGSLGWLGKWNFARVDSSFDAVVLNNLPWKALAKRNYPVCTAAAGWRHSCLFCIVPEN